MKTYLLTLIIIGMILLPVISAESSYTFKQNEAIDLKIPVFDENNNPSNISTECYLTVTDKNQNYLVNNALMTFTTGGIYNYTVSSGTLGTSYASMSCSDGTTSGFSTFTIEITPSGYQGTLGFYIILLVALAAVIILGFSIKEGWFVVIGGMGLIILGIYSVNNGIAGFRDMFMTWAVSLFLIGVGTFLSIKSTLEMMDIELS